MSWTYVMPVTRFDVPEGRTAVQYVEERTFRPDWLSRTSESDALDAIYNHRSVNVRLHVLSLDAPTVRTPRIEDLHWKRLSWKIAEELRNSVLATVGPVRTSKYGDVYLTTYQATVRTVVAVEALAATPEIWGISKVIEVRLDDELDEHLMTWDGFTLVLGMRKLSWAARRALEIVREGLKGALDYVGEPAEIAQGPEVWSMIRTGNLRYPGVRTLEWTLADRPRPRLGPMPLRDQVWDDWADWRAEAVW